MAGRTNRKTKTGGNLAGVLRPVGETLDYHEGLSVNQVKIILHEFGFDHYHLQRFNEWMYGQTCPIIRRDDKQRGGLKSEGGVYEYDLFRWIANQRKEAPLIWD